MSRVSTLNRGRSAFARSSWTDAYEQLSAADTESPLDAEDLERLAQAAYLTGRDADNIELLVRAHREHLHRGDTDRAALAAFWVGFSLMLQGENARGNGWLARARRLVDGNARETVVGGYLLLAAAFRCMRSDDSQGAYAAFCAAAEIGARFDDLDLLTISRQGQGRALIRDGSIVEGVALLDEAMVSVTSGEVSPMVSGNVYCSVLDACHETFDLRRAREWTDALAEWCARQPGLVAHRGECLVHRAEIMQLHGEWPGASEQASRACEWLTKPPAQPAAGAAFYQQGELHRVRGDLASAEAAYREASRLGRSPHPGLALLRLAEGKIAAATSAARQLLAESRDRRTRSRVLDACVEILLAARDVAGARAAAEELARIDAALGAPYLHAIAAGAMGAVLLAEEQPQLALRALRDAWSEWREIGAPYEVARTRTLIALAHGALGDDDTARIELEAAAEIFERLGALPDAVRARQLVSGVGKRPEHDSLTLREQQVLRLVATGKTNRAIAAALEISEKTVARHVSNIFLKLHLSSRAGATAYAYEHGLLQRPA